MSCDLASLDGAYVLGALAPEERLEFERHLAGCPACSRAVRDLAGLPGLLAQVSPDVWEPEPEPVPLPDTLLPGLVREVRRIRRRRRWATGLAAAAVAAIAGGSAAVVTLAGGDDSDSPSAVATTAPPEQMRQLHQHAVTGSLSLTPVAWGTRLDLTCSYGAEDYHHAGDGHAEAPSYSLVVRSTSGDVEHVATWRGLHDRTMHVTGATALTVGQISSVEVRTAGGRPVLQLAG